MAARKQAEPANEAAKQADEQDIYLDPELARIRDAEVKALAEAPEPARAGLLEDPAIDPELVKLRDAEMKRGDKSLV